MPSISPKEIQNRLSDVLERMENAGLDAMIVESRPNTFYLSGFTGTSSLILLTADKSYFITDFRYIEVVRREVKGLKIIQSKESLTKTLGELATELDLKKVGFEGGLSYRSFTSFKKAIRPAKMKQSEIVTDSRLLKSGFEAKKLYEAQQHAEEIFNLVLQHLQPGVSELEIRNFIVHTTDNMGLQGPSFEPIIASGTNSSHPHHHPGQRKLTKNDIVTIDMGVIFDGYCSDMTRTVFLGKPTALMTEVYEIVLEAQLKGLAAIYSGISAREVDRAVRDHITDAGYGDYFGHGTGHGVGIEIHENPYANTITKDILKTGMSLTIEPGIYLPGKFGIRIEDTVIVQPEGCFNLMAAPKEMIIL